MSAGHTITFGSLFAGIGGFDLGLERAGMKCLWQCERDKFCNKVLAKHWPEVTRYDDITTLNAAALAPVDLICGGYPCQPFSTAGERKGAEDDRHLWPEMRRIISAVNPSWVLCENVAGHITMGLDEVLSDLESLGYSVQPFVIPACAVDAHHRRDRVWVLANSESNRRSKRRESRNIREKNGGPDVEMSRESCLTDYVADSIGNGLQRRGTSGIGEQARAGNIIWETTSRGCGDIGPGRRSWTPEPIVGRVAHGVSSALDGALRRYGLEHFNDTEAFSALISHRLRVLRSMWSNGKSEPSPQNVHRIGCDHSLPEVPHADAHEQWYLGRRIKENEELRCMWDRICSQTLQETQDMQRKMLVRIGEIERHEKVAASRVNRLRSLGNAVVPQVVEMFGRFIMESSK